MINEIGKYLRSLRERYGERLFDMARKIEVSSAFLSSIEHGKKKPPEGFVSNLTQLYSLSEKEVESLQTAIDKSQSQVKLTASRPLARETAAVFARKVDSLSDKKLKKIQAIINAGRKSGE